MQVPANARLGRTYDAQTIGVSVLDLAGKVVKPWSRAGVRKDFPGWWSVAGGVTVPDSGGFIRWSTERGEHIAQESILPLPALDVTAITRRLDSLVGNLQRATTTTVSQMTSQQETVSELLQTQSEDIAFIRQWCNDVAAIGRISSEVDAMQQRLGRLVGGRVTDAVTPPAPVSELTDGERLAYERQITALQSKLGNAVAVVDKFLARLEGQIVYEQHN